MALTLNQFIGFETGGLEEATSVTNTPQIFEVPVRTGRFALKMRQGVTILYHVNVFDEVSSAGNDHIFGVAFRTNDKTPNVNWQLIRIATSSGARVSSLDLHSDGDLVWRGLSSDLITITDPLSNDTWHYIEVYFQNLASGNFEIFIDGVSQGTGSGNMSGTIAQFRFEQSSAQTTSDGFWDDMYYLTGASSASDRLGPSEVFGYQSGHATNDDIGDPLTNGTWDEAGDTPLVEEADGTAVELNGSAARTQDTDMDDANARGQGPGPSGDARVDGDSNNVGAKFVFRLKRGNGSGTSLGYRYGNSGDGVTSSGNIESSLTTAYGNFLALSEAATVVPLSTEFFRIGLEAGTTDTGGREIFMADGWAMLLHTPTDPALTALTDAEFPLQNYYVGPFEI